MNYNREKLLQKELERLMSLVYQYVGCQHHKDRDCHLTITEYYSYGRPPTFEVIYDTYFFQSKRSQTFESRESALSFSVDYINKLLREDRDHFKTVLEYQEEYDSTLVELCKVLLKEPFPMRYEPIPEIEKPKPFGFKEGGLVW